MGKHQIGEENIKHGKGKIIHEVNRICEWIPPSAELRGIIMNSIINYN